MTISLLPQYLVNGILAGMIYAVFTSGYSLIFATSRFMHIANGGILSLCGMLTWYCAVSKGMPIAAAILIGMAAALLTGVFIELCIYRHLRANGLPFLLTMIVSLGCMTVIQSLLALLLGNNMKYFPSSAMLPTLFIGSVAIPGWQLVCFGISGLLLIAMLLILNHTRIGSEIQAVASNSEMARLIGYGGIVSMAQAGVFGIGAYCVAILTLHGVNFWLAILPAIALCVLANILMTLPSVRAGGLYFMVVSFGFCKLMNAVFSNWTAVTGGSYGLSGIPKATVFGHSVTGGVQQMILVWVILLVCFYTTNRLMRSPYGELVEAMRQDETALEALGKSPFRIKVVNSSISGVFCAIAAALYIQYIGYADPVNFNQDASFTLTIYVFLGGAATMLGSIAGPVFMLLIPRLIAFLPIPAAMTGAIEQLIYGLLLVVFMMFRPEGLVKKKSGHAAMSLSQWFRQTLCRNRQ